ncbi:hypothetical protein ACIHFE_28765 [Streptomyces sp. NPDC052396]|uniref:hypothetical protein n=1 Tax=Streptomyces sp. NPDC052396 TaxID=3365689 RepID=UPI0037D5A984
MTLPPPSFGSAGEHRLQQHLGTAGRAARFYDRQVRSHLTPEMQEFIGRQAMVFLATVIDDRTLAYPEFRWWRHSPAQGLGLFHRVP